MPHSTEVSEARYFAILDVAADAIISMDAQQHMTVFNQGAEAIFGWLAEDVLGKPLELLIPERFRELHHRHVTDFLEAPDTARKMGERLRVWGRRRDGSEFPAAASISKVHIDGDVVLTVILRDMTDTLQASAEISNLNLELAQRATELGHANAELTRLTAMQRAILDFAGYGIAATDLDGMMLSFNPAAEELLGYSAAEIIGRQTPQLWHDASEIEQRAAELSRELGREVKPGFEVFTVKAREQIRDDREWTFIRKDGTRLPVQLAITALRDAQGEVTGFLGIFSDISERKRTEQAILRLNRELSEHAAELAAANTELTRLSAMQRAILDFAGYAIISADREGRITTFNPAAEKLLGYTTKEIIGQQPALAWHDAKEVADRAQALSRRLGQEVPPNFRVFGALADRNLRDEREWTFIRKDGRRVPVVLSITALRDAQGDVTGYLGIAADITERKRHEEAIRALNSDLQHRAAQLEAVNRELEAFSYSVSHDLRTPLRSIDGFSQVLLEDYADKLDAPGRDYLGRVRAASQRMAQLIDDLLNLSRLTRGVMRNERVDLSALAHAVADELGKSQPERQVELRIENGIQTQGDPRLLRVLLDNLLGNAWKYTSKHAHAKIEFGVEARIDDRIVCFVRDDGAGFDPAYADKLFGAFQRLHASAEFPGSGIGLVTAQRIVHRHGGDIWAEGTVEQGATFRFSLPAAASPEPNSDSG